MSTKGGSGGGGNVHPKGENSMPMSGLGCSVAAMAGGLFESVYET